MTAPTRSQAVQRLMRFGLVDCSGWREGIVTAYVDSDLSTPRPRDMVAVRQLLEEIDFVRMVEFVVDNTNGEVRYTLHLENDGAASGARNLTDEHRAILMEVLSPVYRRYFTVVGDVIREDRVHVATILTFSVLSGDLVGEDELKEVGLAGEPDAMTTGIIRAMLTAGGVVCSVLVDGVAPYGDEDGVPDLVQEIVEALHGIYDDATPIRICDRDPMAQLVTAYDYRS